FASHVGEATVAVVPVKVQAGEIAHHHQVQVPVIVQIDKRRAENAPPAFPLQARGGGRVGEISVTVAQQQVSGMPVVGVGIIGSENLAECGDPVLTQKQIQVAVVV